MDITWYNPAELPDLRPESLSGISYDVLCYCEELDEHYIGFYSYNTHAWQIVGMDRNRPFEWRYLTRETDYPKSE